MKTFIKKIKLYLVGALIALGFWGISLTSNPPEMLGKVQTISIKFEEREGEGRIPYNLVVGDYIYHFWNLEQIEQFADRVDAQDDEQTALVRRVIKEELKTKSIETLKDELKTQKTYNINDTITIQ